MEMWTVCIREMRPFTIPAVFTVLFVLLAAAVHRLVLVPYRETRKIYEQFVLGYVMEDLAQKVLATRFHRRASRQSCA